MNFVFHMGKSLHHDVSRHIICWKVFEGDIFLIHLLPSVVKLDVNVFGADVECSVLC